MLNLNSYFFFKKIIHIENFVRTCINKNVQKFEVFKKISLIIILPNLKSLEDNSILNAFLLLKSITNCVPTIKKLYITKSKTYFVIIKVTLHDKEIYKFFQYFLNSYLNLSNSEKKISFNLFVNKKMNILTFFIKNVQMFSEIAEHFLTWRYGLFINFFFKSKYLDFIDFFKTFGFFK